jgi:hypothetical protein
VFFFVCWVVGDRFHTEPLVGLDAHVLFVPRFSFTAVVVVVVVVVLSPYPFPPGNRYNTSCESRGLSHAFCTVGLPE